MEIQEIHEKIHEAAHHGHEHEGAGDHTSPKAINTKLVAVMIGALACLLAIIEIGANSSQNASLSANIESSDKWAFYQAKTIRMSILEAAADMAEIVVPAEGQTAVALEARQKRIADWRSKAKRMDSDPEKGEGRKELMASAKEAEQHRDHALASYHIYEYAAAALQIAIVLASSSIATGLAVLLWGAGGLGLVGIGLGLIARLAPALLHFH